MSREEAMRRHPSYLARVVRDAQDQQAMDVANREWVDLEEWGMAPPSRINERHHEWSVEPPAWVESVKGALFGLVLFAVIFGMCVAGQWFGGWPA